MTTYKRYSYPISIISGGTFEKTGYTYLESISMDCICSN